MMIWKPSGIMPTGRRTAMKRWLSLMECTKGLKAFSDGRLFYVITDDETGVVNDNIMVRKHYDVNNGYYIKSSRLHKELSKDLWCFGSRETIENEYKSNPFICGK